MTITFPTSTTIQIRLESGNRTPIDWIIMSYATGDWAISDDVDINQFTDIEIWDEDTESVYTTDIVELVRVRTDNQGQGRYIICINSQNMVKTTMNFSEVKFDTADNDGQPANQ